MRTMNSTPTGRRSADHLTVRWGARVGERPGFPNVDKAWASPHLPTARSSGLLDRTVCGWRHLSSGSETLDAQISEAVKIPIFGYKAGNTVLAAQRHDLRVEDEIADRIGLSDGFHR